MNIYTQGQLVKCRASFVDEADELVDPTTVTFKVKTPAGATTTYLYATDVELVKDAVGRYRVNVNANAVGVWVYRFESTGTNQTADEESFEVRQGAF